MVRFRGLRWTEWSEDHIGHRGIGLAEVEEVVLYLPQYVKSGRGGTTLVYGTTSAGRMLPVVLIPDPDGDAFVVTAREMSDNERRAFRRKERNHD